MVLIIFSFLKKKCILIFCKLTHISKENAGDSGHGEPAMDKLGLDIPPKALWVLTETKRVKSKITNKSMPYIQINK